MKLKERLKKIKELEDGVVTPWEVMRIFGRVSIFGHQVSFDSGGNSDYVDSEELKEALTWLVNELGGNVKWDKKGVGNDKK